MVMVVGISLALAKQRAQIESHLQSRSLLHRTICNENCKPDDRTMTAMRSDGEPFLSNLTPCSIAIVVVRRSQTSEREFGLPII
jgi:hypothetical protein